MQATPFLKWVGGKQAMFAALKSRFPTDFEVFYDPFVGGGSVALGLAHPRTVVGDSNQELMRTYVGVRDDWRAVARQLDEMLNTKEAYLQVRALDPTRLVLHACAARFIYLNKTGFRGLYRVNRYGQLNVPYGAYDRAYYDPTILQAAAVTMGSWQLHACSYEGLLRAATAIS